MPKILFKGSQRLGTAAADCTGAIGAAVLSCEGAFLPEERQDGNTRKSQRGGRPRFAPKRASDNPSYPALALVQWCESLLAGAECSYTGSVVTDAERDLIVRCLVTFLQHCGTEILPRASIEVVKSILKLLDSSATLASDVSRLLEALKEALSGCKAQDLAQVLPDLLDVLLGCAVDPAIDQTTRYVS